MIIEQVVLIIRRRKTPAVVLKETVRIIALGDPKSWLLLFSNFVAHTTLALPCSDSP